ncbi:hypothetical protein HA402_009725 [Bradysia odoriphaga]|nr:hypothetical protein HA402_009725 [Bradysia odoriphaga]
MDEIREAFPANKKRILPPIKLNPLGNLSRSQRFWLALKGVWRSYVESTSVHGFFYLRGVESAGFKRLFSTVCCIRYHHSEYYLDVQKITVGKPDPLISISFPGITLCHPQTVVNYKAKRFVEKLRISDEYTKSDLLAMLPTALGVFTDNQWGQEDTNQLSMVHDLLRQNGLSVLDAVRAVSTNCSELIRRCSFNKKAFPCFQDHEHLTFRETLTPSGVCCTFNFNPSNSSYQPLNVNSYGVRGGLSIIATSIPHTNDGMSGLLFSDGFIMHVHSPYDFPTDASYMTLLGIGQVTLVGVHPTLTTVSADVHALPVVSRRCLTGPDVGLNIYRRAACATKCMAQFIHEKCECHPYFLPAIDDGTQIRDCIVTDGECFQRIYYDIKKIRCSACNPACEDVIYKISAATVDYNFANVSINPI